MANTPIPRGRPRILIIGNEMVADSLTNFDDEIVAVAEESGSDLVVIDVQEEDLRGVAMRDGEIPAVFLGPPAVEEKVNQAGWSAPFACLEQPFSGQELHATIEITLQRHRFAERRKRSADVPMLEQTAEALAEFAARLFSAHEDEKQQIARDIHDDIMQRLALAQIELDGIGQRLPPSYAERVASQFRGISGHINQLMEDLRELAHRLRPAMLDDLGLAAALRRLADDFAERQSIPTRFSAGRLSMPIPSAASLNIYRIAQEALRNVADHAGPASVNIALIGGSGGLDFGIRDNGRGFDLETAWKCGGFGLATMARRAEFAGGSFEVLSEPGAGTQIHVRIPFERESEFITASTLSP